MTRVANVRFKRVMRWSAEERQFRLFRFMWETVDDAGNVVSNKLAVSIKNWLPRVTLRQSWGGRFE
jgi:hypothetical protein